MLHGARLLGGIPRRKCGKFIIHWLGMMGNLRKVTFFPMKHRWSCQISIKEPNPMNHTKQECKVRVDEEHCTRDRSSHSARVAESNPPVQSGDIWDHWQSHTNEPNWDYTNIEIINAVINYSWLTSLWLKYPFLGWHNEHATDLPGPS